MLGDANGEVESKRCSSTASVSATKPYKGARGLRGHNRDVFAGCLTERSGSGMKEPDGPSQTDKLRYAGKVSVSRAWVEVSTFRMCSYG